MRLLTFLSVLVLSLYGFANSSDGGSGKTCPPGKNCSNGLSLPGGNFPTGEFLPLEFSAFQQSLRFLDYQEGTDRVVFEVIDKTGVKNLINSEMQQLVDTKPNLADAIFDSYESGSNWVDIRQL